MGSYTIARVVNNGCRNRSGVGFFKVNLNVSICAGALLKVNGCSGMSRVFKTSSMIKISCSAIQAPTLLNRISKESQTLERFRGKAYSFLAKING